MADYVNRTADYRQISMHILNITSGNLLFDAAFIFEYCKVRSGKSELIYKIGVQMTLQGTIIVIFNKTLRW